MREEQTPWLYGPGQDSGDMAFRAFVTNHLKAAAKVSTNTINQRDQQGRALSQGLRDTNIRLWHLEREAKDLKKANKTYGEVILCLLESVDASREEIKDLDDAHQKLRRDFNDAMENVIIPFISFASEDIAAIKALNEHLKKDRDFLVIPREESHFTEEVDEG